MKNKGFTLIELLAVITIMGILMLVAIPAITRTIENSRRDTFADISHEYINAVRNAVLADNITCTVGSETMNASATPGGTYIFKLGTNPNTESNPAYQQTKDLMESGGNSPFGNAYLTGYVLWEKASNDETGKTTMDFSMVLVDAGGHGFAEETAEDSIKRSAVKTSGQTYTDKTEGVSVCTLS